MESAVGQEVVLCLRENYRRDTPVDPNMNLELDLGFDSMERVEFFASLEQVLNLKLPEDFGADILTVRDLILQLERQAGAATRAGAASRQSWTSILSEESLDREETAQFRMSGPALTAIKYGCVRLLDWLLFQPLLRLDVRGAEHLPAEGTFLICPNHQSYLDPFVLVAALPYRVFRRMFFVGYSVFFGTRLMATAARLANIVLVDPDAHLLRAMKAGAYGLRKGRILCIFPEGGRSFDGELQDFKKGAAILSRELSVPIVPVIILGTHLVWARDSARIRLHKVKVHFGKPVFPSPSAAADPYQADTDALRSKIEEMIRDTKFEIRDH
jgi:long-chain acyl-CoA synthetase